MVCWIWDHVISYQLARKVENVSRINDSWSLEDAKQPWQKDFKPHVGRLHDDFRVQRVIPTSLQPVG